jgi:hypothetical protein
MLGGSGWHYSSKLTSRLALTCHAQHEMLSNCWLLRLLEKPLTTTSHKATKGEQQQTLCPLGKQQLQEQAGFQALQQPSQQGKKQKAAPQGNRVNTANGSGLPRKATATQTRLHAVALCRSTTILP